MPKNLQWLPPTKRKSKLPTWHLRASIIYPQMNPSSHMENSHFLGTLKASLPSNICWCSFPPRKCPAPSPTHFTPSTPCLHTPKFHMLKINVIPATMSSWISLRWELTLLPVNSHRPQWVSFPLWFWSLSAFYYSAPHEVYCKPISSSTRSATCLQNIFYIIDCYRN